MKDQSPRFIKPILHFLLKTPLFWIAGSGILSIIILGAIFLREEERESGEWVIYLLFPVLFISVLIFLNQKHSLFFSAIKIILIVLFLIVEVSLYFHPMVMVCATGFFIILLFINRKELSIGLSETSYIDKVPVYFVYLISSLASIKLCYWDDFNYFLQREHPIVIIGMAFILICFLNFKFNLKFPRYGRLLFNILKFLIPFVVFLIASIRVYEMDESQLHHWGCYVGPAELVRQGGYLLWNIPSQYGFLSILSIAVAPVSSCWQSFYLLQILFLLVTSAILFVILFFSNKNLVNYFLSLIIVFVSLFLVPGDVNFLRGVSSYPSVGPYRFLWVYVLLFFIVLQYRKKLVNEKWEVILGSFIWLMASWWSFESAYYVSLPWFGYLFIKSLKINENNSLDYKGSIQAVLLSWLIPVLVFLISVLLLCSFYLLKLKHSPDFLSYYEHALSFKEGFGSLPITINGALGVVLLVLLFAACFIWESWSNIKKNKNYISVIVASILVLYSCLSYFIGRSHENNILNIIPIIVLVVAVISLINKWEGYSFTNTLFKYFSYPLYLVIIVLSIGNKNALGNYFDDVKAGYRDIQQMNPSLQTSLEALMIDAGITGDDSIAFQANFMLVKYQRNGRESYQYKHWLPLNPMTVLNPIREDRQKIYLERFTDQFKSGGYFIRNKQYTDRLERFLSEEYNMSGPVYENEEWRITKFVRKKNGLFRRQPY